MTVKKKATASRARQPNNAKLLAWLLNLGTHANTVASHAASATDATGRRRQLDLLFDQRRRSQKPLPGDFDEPAIVLPFDQK